MTKAKVVEKLKADGATFREGISNTGEFFFEAWLPGEAIWDNSYQCGGFYVEKSRNESMAEFWKYVAYQMAGEVKQV